jgi:hypothetical protein
MSLIPVFPSTNSIPPASFYNIQGLTNWLNFNPSYKKYFVGIYPGIYEVNSTFSTFGYDPANVPLCSDVSLLSQFQAQQYNQQLNLFRNAYAYNSNAYVNYTDGLTPAPIYYTFATFQEQTQYMSAVSLVNKLYPFQIMAQRVGWITPFPI